MIELHKQFDKITADVKKLKSTDNQSIERSEISPTITLIAEQIPVTKTENHIEPIVEEDATTDKNGRKTYSEADKRFVADGSNSLATLVEKYGFENKKSASNPPGRDMRSCALSFPTEPQTPVTALTVFTAAV